MEGTEGMEGVEGTDGVEFVEGTEGTEGMEGAEGAEGLEGMEGVEGMESMIYIGLLWLAVVGTQPIRMLIYRSKRHRGQRVWPILGYCDWLWWGLNQSKFLYIGQKVMEGMEGTEHMTYIGLLWGVLQHDHRKVSELQMSIIERPCLPLVAPHNHILSGW